jgi:IS5 family transposase
LYKKGDGDMSRLCYLGHALMENRNGLVVDATTTLASGTDERDAALIMAGRSINKAGTTLGADKGYDAAAFVKELRAMGVTPHVAQKKHSAIDGRTTRHAVYAVSIKKRKLVEEIFGWSKTIGGLRKARFVGLAKVAPRPRSISPLTPDAHGDDLWLAFIGGGGITASIE